MARVEINRGSSVVIGRGASLQVSRYAPPNTNLLGAQSVLSGTPVLFSPIGQEIESGIPSSLVVTAIISSVVLTGTNGMTANSLIVSADISTPLGSDTLSSNGILSSAFLQSPILSSSAEINSLVALGVLSQALFNQPQSSTFPLERNLVADSVVSTVVLSTPTATDEIPRDWIADDESMNLEAAYSIWKLSSSATLCMRVKNASNVEADIGFGSDFMVSESELSAHCGTGIGIVTKIYEQTGKGSNYDLALVYGSPRIWDGTARTTDDNGNVEIYAPGDIEFATVATASNMNVHGSSDRMILTVARIDLSEGADDRTNSPVYSFMRETYNSNVQVLYGSPQALYAAYSSSNGRISLVSFGLPTDYDGWHSSVQRQITDGLNGTTVSTLRRYKKNSLLPQYNINGGVTINTDASANLRIGVIRAQSTNRYRVHISELLVVSRWDNTQRANITNDQIARFNSI